MLKTPCASGLELGHTSTALACNVPSQLRSSSSTTRGNTPHGAGTPPPASDSAISVRHPLGPNIVYVLPLPVCERNPEVH